nr:PREDICTED: mitochondrial enolase superfamily member 1-like [Linepithema humile]
MRDIQFDDVKTYDIRFPASVKRARTNVQVTDFDPDFCGVYVIIGTKDENYKGYGIALVKDIDTDTDKDTDRLMERIVESMFHEILKDKTTTRIYNELGAVWRSLSTMTLHWKFNHLRPAAIAIISALWDLWARIEDKPVWKLLADMTPQELITTIDFSDVMDIITPEEALQMLTCEMSLRECHEELLKQYGCFASVTGIGYHDNLSKNKGYTYQRIRDLCRNFKKLDLSTFEVYADRNVGGSVIRCLAIAKMMGKRRGACVWRKPRIVLNANEITWELEQLSSFLETLYNISRRTKIRSTPYCIELAWAAYKTRSIQNKMKGSDIKASSGEKCDSHLEFKELAISCLHNIWQINIGKVGLNEALIIYLIAHKNKLPVWLHGDGLGLSEMGQHVQMWDYVCLNRANEIRLTQENPAYFNNRIIEFVNYQHGYFENPVYILKGFYMPPTHPGFSTKLKKKCTARWSYPDGTQWQHLIKIKDLKKGKKKAELEKDDRDDMIRQNPVDESDK